MTRFMNCLFMLLFFYIAFPFIVLLLGKLLILISSMF